MGNPQEPPRRGTGKGTRRGPRRPEWVSDSALKAERQKTAGQSGQPDGREQIGLSIETYRFEDNGDVTIRTYYKVPRHSEAEMGELFQTYLPEDG